MRRQAGLTLIELMVGLAILAMLLFAGVPSFSGFIQNRAIRNAADAVTDGLNLAKAEAVRRNTGVRFALDATGGWTVGCVTVLGDCPGTIQERPSATGGGKIATTAVTINFSGYGQAISLVGDATINVTNVLGTCEDAGGTMRCLRVVVSPGGRIRMCDPKLTATNPTSPQACS